MTASPSQPPMLTALQLEVLEEFGAVSHRSERFAAEAEWEARAADSVEQRRVRARAEILADLRRLEAIEDGYEEPEFVWRTCPTCFLEFAILLPERGRPRVHCCRRHSVLAAVRAWVGRIVVDRS